MGSCLSFRSTGGQHHQNSSKEQLSDTPNTNMDSGFTPNEVELKGLDTVISFPQWYLNFNLADILAHGKTTSGNSLQNISLSVGGTVFLTGTISALKVNLYIPNNPQAVTFTISFSSGTFSYYNIEKPGPPPLEQADITGLTFGFQVDMAQQSVDMKSLPSNIQGQVQSAASNLGNGAFTIQQLFMDFQNADLDMYDPSKTVWPANFPSPAKSSLSTYIKAYVLDVQTAGNILGYAVTVDNPGNVPDAIPTFPPTGLMFTVNQYQLNSDPKSGDLNADFDTLNFNMMTGDRSFPRLNPMPWMGNFVVPPGSDQSFGVMAISKELIMQKWLAPVLSPLITSYWGLSDTDTSADPAYKVLSGSLVANGTGLSFTSPAQSSKSHHPNDGGIDDVIYNMSVQVNVTPNIGPDNPSISITKTTSWDMDYTHWFGAENHAATSECHIWYSVTLEATIKFIGVSDGQVQVEVVSKATPVPDPNAVYTLPGQWLVTKPTGLTNIWNKVSGTLNSVVMEAFSTAVPVALPADLTPLLTKNLPTFVVPGSSQLFLRDIFFNNEGDMMIGLAYK